MKELLADDHSELDVLLKGLFAALDTGAAPDVYQKLDMFWARLAMHIRAEHLHLFPAILSRLESEKEIGGAPDFETAQTAVASLRADHDFFMDELAAAIKQLRGLRDDPRDTSQRLLAVRETITAVSRRLETHNRLEETEVYQWADALLAPAERENLNGKMQKELDNLPPRFASAE